MSQRSNSVRAACARPSGGYDVVKAKRAIKRVLSRKTVELMTTNHLHGVKTDGGGGIGLSFDDVGFGLGFSIVTDVGARGIPGSVGEFGWGGASHSTYWVDPKEQLVVVYLAQLLPAGDVDDHAKMRALAYQALEEPAGSTPRLCSGCPER
jgi:CubicO group peptidase (beta-lactamase class C family)